MVRCGGRRRDGGAVVRYGGRRRDGGSAVSGGEMRVVAAPKKESD